MSRFPINLSRPALALALSVSLVGVGVGIVAAKPGPGNCTNAIAGTYYGPTDFLVTLDAGGGAIGQFSETSQALIGLGPTFAGQWTCKGNALTLQDFRFFDSSGFRGFEETYATATFNGSNALTFSYTFYEYPETVTAADVVAHSGAIVFTFGPATVNRVSTL